MALTIKQQIACLRNRLYRVALAWCADEMLADDLAQQTITAGIDHVDQLRDPDRLAPWLFRILRNNWHQHLRKNKKFDELDDHALCDDNGPYMNCESQELVIRVRHAVATLPLDQRQVLSLVDLEDMSYCEVAHILDIPVGTVMSRLYRARKTLLSRMEKAPVTSRREQIHLVETKS